MMDVRSEARTIDPILNLRVHSSVKSLCFVSQNNSDPFNKYSNGNVDDIDSSQSSEDDDDDDDDDDEIQFRSTTLRHKENDPVSFHNNSRRVLNGRFLASCHSDGEALLWDLNNQKKLAIISSPRGGPGLAIRRMNDSTQILFQTRDTKGIVSLHSVEQTTTTNIRQYETLSHTFCQAAPCYGNKHLLALPSLDNSTVTLVDGRTDNNIAQYKIKGHGMLTSLALCTTASTSDGGHSTGRPILACGMESGTVTFFDILSGSRSSSEASFSLGKDPILTLDVTPSGTHAAQGVKLPFDGGSDSLLIAAGMAGDSEDISMMSSFEAGRAVIFKTTHCFHHDCKLPKWTFKQRARLSTCRVDRESFNGKPGVSICRFRPQDGRLLAVGGWDFRIRLFERSKGNAIAILKGNKGSIVGLDWSPDASTSGLFASASGNDKSISIWQCFANR